eukprot:8539035-Ditylum_brightwellii.AAC.1
MATKANADTSFKTSASEAAMAKKNSFAGVDFASKIDTAKTMFSFTQTTDKQLSNKDGAKGNKEHKNGKEKDE